MKKLLIIIISFLLIYNTVHAETLFINKNNAKTITVKQVKKAIKHGANVNAKEKGGVAHPLLLASGFNTNPVVITTLIKYGA